MRSLRMKPTKIRERRWTRVSMEMIVKARVGDIYISEVAGNSGT